MNDLQVYYDELTDAELVACVQGIKEYSKTGILTNEALLSFIQKIGEVTGVDSPTETLGITYTLLFTAAIRWAQEINYEYKR